MIDNTVTLSPTHIIKAALLRTREPSQSGASDDFAMEYRAPNGRIFEVREYDSGQFFMSEMCPVPRLARYDEERDTYHYLYEPRLKGIMDDPNAFAASARGMGIDLNDVVRTGSGIGVASIFYDSLEDVAAAVATALDANLWYDSVDHAKLADPEFQERMRRINEEQSAAYRAERQAMHEAAVEHEHGLFKGLHSMIGPLSDGTKKAILSYLNDPTEDQWDAIYSKIINGHGTVWQAWIEVDRNAPKSKPSDRGWPSIPDPDTLRAALRKASGMAHEPASPVEDGVEDTVVPMPFRR